MPVSYYPSHKPHIRRVEPIVLINGKRVQLAGMIAFDNEFRRHVAQVGAAVFNDAVIAELPKATEVVKISSYEHLDTMWAASSPDLVWPRILNNLASHTAEEERVAKHH